MSLICVKNFLSPIVAFCNLISMKLSYMQIFFFFLPIIQFHGNRVTKHHYRFLKRYYKLLKNTTIGLNSILKKIEFQNSDISLISLGKIAKCWIVFLKKAKANFFPNVCMLLANLFCPLFYFYKSIHIASN